MMAGVASESLVELEARRDGLRGQRAALQARAAVLDVGISEVQAIVNEAEARLREQEGIVFRARSAAGPGYHFGGAPLPTVMWTSGGETRQLTGPAPIDSPKGQADHAHRVYAALETEVQHLRSSLATLQNERRPIDRSVGLLGLEIETVEQQMAGSRAEEAERAQLLGEHLTWRDRLARIMSRLGGGG